MTPMARRRWSMTCRFIDLACDKTSDVGITLENEQNAALEPMPSPGFMIWSNLVIELCRGAHCSSKFGSEKRLTCSRD
jgi:hypothetical protein